MQRVSQLLEQCKFYLSDQGLLLLPALMKPTMEVYSLGGSYLFKTYTYMLML